MPRPTRTDESIRQEINERLAEEALLDARQIRVTVRHGQVTLEGRVDRRQAKYRAEDVADAVRGVKDIHNRLRVEPAEPGEPEAEPSGAGEAAGRDLESERAGELR